jgi:hypothetical protein
MSSLFLLRCEDRSITLPSSSPSLEKVWTPPVEKILLDLVQFGIFLDPDPAPVREWMLLFLRVLVNLPCHKYEP